MDGFVEFGAEEFGGAAEHAGEEEGGGVAEVGGGVEFGVEEGDGDVEFVVEPIRNVNNIPSVVISVHFLDIGYAVWSACDEYSQTYQMIRLHQTQMPHINRIHTPIHLPLPALPTQPQIPIIFNLPPRAHPHRSDA